jgi:glycosyltransferase involved in cell wall biosynthesis
LIHFAPSIIAYSFPDGFRQEVLSMRVLLFRHGDYGQAYGRFQAGEPESYRDQRHSVDYVASLAPEHEVTTVAICDRPHDEVLAPGLRSIGVPDALVWDSSRLWPLLDQVAPEAFICRTPNRAVIVASRHDYAEGLPNTIFEAFASRTPLIASDHPAFIDRLRPTVDSLRFHAGHARDLAEQVERLMHGPELYTRLSRQSASALSDLYVGIEWTDLVARFLDDPTCKRDWTKGYTLADRPNRCSEGPIIARPAAMRLSTVLN